MGELTAGLAELHRLLSDLSDVENQIALGPKRIARAGKTVKAAEAGCLEQKDTITQLKKAADEKSLQLKSNEARIADLRAKLNAAASNREYEIISSQIEADSMANSVLEDEILEGYESVDDATRRLTELEEELASAVAEREAVTEQVAAEKPGLEARRAELNEQIREAEKIIPTKIMGQYRRLVGAHGHEALAVVDDGACENCYSVISPQESVLLNTDKLVFCRSCGRLLFRR